MDQWQQRIEGFLSKSQIDLLKEKTVFVPGCGAIGSYALNILARTGVGNLIIADFDHYQPQNIPGQLFCNLESVNSRKAETAKQWVESINPDCKVTVYDETWTERNSLNSILEASDVLLLGFDTLSPGILLYREAVKYKLPIVDFYYGPLLSTFVTFPGDPTPEQRFKYPTRQKEWYQADDREIASESLLRLSAFVLSNCPWVMDELDHAAIQRFLELGKISVLPSLVAIAGTSMADSAIEVLLGKPMHHDYKGYFYDWRKGRNVLPMDPHEIPEIYEIACDKIASAFQNSSMEQSELAIAERLV